jgi:hypothetical protein
MSMKKTDLEKNKAMKIAGQMHAAGTAPRYGQGAAAAGDRREQRRRDAAAGLVPFACKLPQALLLRVHEHAAGREGSVNETVAQLLTQALDRAA